jgi:hypothetical protein
MRFLRNTWSGQLLPTALIGLLFNISPVHAAEASNQGGADTADVDLAKIQAGGKVVLISSGGRGGQFLAIDGDNRTTFRFSSSDPRPTLIVKFVESRPVHRVSVVLGSKGGKIDVYLFNELPRHPSDLDNLKPVGSIVDPGIAREAGVEFAPQNARYVALRWTLSSTHLGPVTVAEVSAFTKGDSPEIAMSLAAVSPPISLVSDPPLILPVSP